MDYVLGNYYEIKKECLKYLEEINYAEIDWNALNNDSVKKFSNYELLNNLKKSIKGKNSIVILMHDTKDVSNSSNVLADSIRYLLEEGYEFRTFYDFIHNNEAENIIWQ